MLHTPFLCIGPSKVLRTEVGDLPMSTVHDSTRSDPLFVRTFPSRPQVETETV